MEVSVQQHDDLVELSLAGRLDNESDELLCAAVNEQVQLGRHRIVADLRNVTFMSSAGLSSLLRCQKMLSALRGLFFVCHPSEEVERVLRLTKTHDLLVRERELVAAISTEGTVTVETRTRIQSRNGIDVEIYTIDDQSELTCRVVGQPEHLFDGGYQPQDCGEESFPADCIGLGIGGLGGGFEDCRRSFGDFLAAAGIVVHATGGEGEAPDYLQAQENYVPHVHVLCGIRCVGSFGWLLRFYSAERDEPAGLDDLVGLAMDAVRADSVGLVMLAESAGLVGACLKKSPVAGTAEKANRFQFPEIREWISFSGERTDANALTLVVGVASRTPVSPPLGAMLRPLSSDGSMAGHFHAVTHPYQPLKKRSLDLHQSLRDLYASGAAKRLLHLLNDDRETLGAGQSEFISGAVWVSPIRDTQS